MTPPLPAPSNAPSPTSKPALPTNPTTPRTTASKAIASPVCEVFRPAIRRNAAAIIIAHNHPSGDPAPSPEDVAVTRQLACPGQMLDMEALDHLVIGQGRWTSLRERRLGFGGD